MSTAEQHDPVSDEPATLEAAFVAAQAEFPAVKRDSENPHFKRKYTSLDELVAATRPVLNRYGLGIRQEVVGHPDTGMPVLRTTLLHVGGAEWASELPMLGGATSWQAFGAALTYARRYAWAAMLGIAAEEDDDAAAAQPPPAQQRGPAMVTDPQMKKISACIGDLQRDGTPIPAGYEGAETWVDVLRMRLREQYDIDTRKALTAGQASELIDWLQAMAVPF
jgi:hypothetical protein